MGKICRRGRFCAWIERVRGAIDGILIRYSVGGGSDAAFTQLVLRVLIIIIIISTTISSLINSISS